MGKIDEKTIARSTQEGRDGNSDSGGSKNAGRESKFSRSQSERIDRAYGEGTNISWPGSAITGGMLGELIGDYSEQIVAKRLAAKQLEDEASRLELRVAELKRLKDELTEIENT